MPFKKLSDHYFVSPQITMDDIPAIVDAGFVTVICNRPDDEVPVSLQASMIRQVTEDAGLNFEALPVTHQTMTPEIVARQWALADTSSGPVLAYCASGTRCSVIWALGAATNQIPIRMILDTTRQAGYNLDNLHKTLVAAAKYAK